MSDDDRDIDIESDVSTISINFHPTNFLKLVLLIIFSNIFRKGMTPTRDRDSQTIPNIIHR